MFNTFQISNGIQVYVYLPLRNVWSTYLSIIAYVLFWFGLSFAFNSWSSSWILGISSLSNSYLEIVFYFLYYKLSFCCGDCFFWYAEDYKLFVVSIIIFLICRQIFNFQRSICWRGCLLYNAHFWHFCLILGGCGYGVEICLGKLFCFSLCVYFFVPLIYWFCYHSFTV